MAKINYIKGGSDEVFLTPSLVFNEDDGYYDCHLMINDICIAYFTEHGVLQLIPFEWGEGFSSYPSEDDRNVQWLENKGIQLETREHEYGHNENKKRWKSYIKVERG